MSARESFDGMSEMTAGPSAPRMGSRAPGVFNLTLSVVLGPIVALANQELIFAANAWACGRGSRGPMHVVPAMCLALVAATGLMAYRDWRSVGGGREDEAGTPATRTRFISLLGLFMSVFSSLVIVAQWIAIFVFEPCMRA